jgi:hypothetical protein
MIASHDIHIADAAQMRLSLVLQRSQLERPRLTVHKDLGSHDWQDLLSQRKSVELADPPAGTVESHFPRNLLIVKQIACYSKSSVSTALR